MTVPAKLLFGYFGDRVSKRVILGGGMMVYALAMVLLMRPSSAWTSLAAVVLIGLAVLVGGIWAIVRAVLVGGRISPPVLTIDRLPLRLGEKFKVAYEQQTRKQCEINKVTVTLTCKEWVRYTVGTNTRTLEHTVCEHEEILAENVQTMGAEPINGEAEFAISADAMHSFDASSNKIKWFLKVHADIARWPDYSDDIAIAVAPRIMEERA